MVEDVDPNGGGTPAHNYNNGYSGALIDQYQVDDYAKLAEFYYSLMPKTS